MAERDVVLEQPARQFLFDVATPGERSFLLRIIRELQEHPEPDDHRKFPMASQSLLLFHDGHFWIVYEILNDFTISILGIGTAE
jgi:hypothetical protein